MTVPLNFSIALFRKSKQHLFAVVRENATAAGTPINQFANDCVVKATVKDKDAVAVAQITNLVLDPVGQGGAYRGLVVEAFDPDPTKTPYTCTISMEKAGGTSHCERTGTLLIVT